MRICDLEKCLEKTKLPAAELRLNILLEDPIEQFLDENCEWRGISGAYVATLGRSSGAERGRDDSLPTLTASVGAFTRLWLGVRSASSLQITDQLLGPADLLAALDELFRLPQPWPGWDF